MKAAGEQAGAWGSGSARTAVPAGICGWRAKSAVSAFFSPKNRRKILAGPQKRRTLGQRFLGDYPDMYWLYWLFILILLAAAAGAALLAYRTYVMGDGTAANFNLAGWLFRQRPEPRLGVIEQASVDARRKLVLIRRDGVEHLIMTGGPVDVVIETGIQAPPDTTLPAEPSPPLFARQPRSFGQAVNE
jgi:hypothetical protein